MRASRYLCVGVAPDVVVAERRVRLPPRGLEPRVLIGRVIQHEIRDHPQAVAMGGLEEAVEVRHGPVVGMDRLVVGDVVAVVAQRRLEEGQEPEAVDAELLQVGELTRQPREVADAVVIAVPEGAHVQFVEDGVLVPEGIVIHVARLGSAQ